MKWITIGIAAVMALFSAWSRPAWAQPAGDATAEQAEQAKQHYERAEAHKTLKEYGEAAKEYLLAYSLVQRPLLLFNVAQVYRFDGKLAEALEYYERYLELEPEGPGASIAREMAQLLRTELEQIRKKQEEEEARRKEQQAQKAAVATLDIPLDTLPAPPQVAVLQKPEERQRAVRVNGMIQTIFDYKLEGIAAVAGVGIGLGERVELRAAGILGNVPGAYVGGALSLGNGYLRPLVGLGVPVFFEQGLRVAVRGTVGGEWAFSQRLVGVAEFGIEQYLNALVTRPGTVLVPSIGIKAWL